MATAFRRITGRWTAAHAACVLCCLAVAPAPAGAAVCDAASISAPLPAEYLRSYHAFFKSPTRLAIDADDNLYVLDALNRRVVVRAPDGRVLREIIGLESPVSVAADSAGRIYVGEGGSGRVDVYDADGVRLRSLGVGAGEFVLPGYLAVHEGVAGGRVYVVDSGADAVQIYAADSAALLGGFGGTGAGPGEFHFPAGIAVTEDAVIVVDRGNSRLQSFDHQGVFVQEIRPPADNCGFLCAFEGPTRGRPHDSGLWPGPGGALYVAEGSKGRLLVLDQAGVGLGTVGDFGVSPGRLRVPTDMVVDSCGRLFVASAANARLEIFGLPGHTDPERFAPGRLALAQDVLDPLVQTTLTAYLELPGQRVREASAILANGFAAPIAVSEGDADGDNIPDLELVFGPELVSSLIGTAEAEISVTGLIGALEFAESARLRLVLTDLDADGDGVTDGADACPDTAAGDAVGPDGCSLAQLCPCEGPVFDSAWRNHGAYVACVEQASRSWVDADIVTRSERGRLVREAARSRCGVPGQRASRAGIR